MEKRITLKEFEEEVFKVEGIKIEIKNLRDDLLVPHYPYTTPMSNEATVSDLINQRIMPVINGAFEELNEAYAHFNWYIIDGDFDGDVFDTFITS